MNTKYVWSLLKETYNDWNEDKAPRLAAALSYYTLFAIAPLILIVISLSGLFFGKETATAALTQEIQNMIGKEGAGAIEDLVSHAALDESTGIISITIGFITLLLAAIGFFSQLQDALNTIWEVEPDPHRSWISFLYDRFASFSMVLGVGFLLLVSLVITTVLSAITKYFEGRLENYAIAGQVLNFFISFFVITLLFAMIFKILPDVKINWSDVWIGAAATSLLFTIGRLLIGIYIGRSNVMSAFGAAGSLVVLMIWVNYSVQILFLGAEFTQVYAKSMGRRIEPTANARLLSKEARIQQGMPRKT